VNGASRSRWFWPVIAVVVVAIAALAIWTLAQVSDLGRTVGVLDITTVLAPTAIS
jgi:hypothetical protein